MILFIRRPGCIALILLLLCAGIYYLRERAHSQLYLVKMYQDMLYWEREDKAYIIKKILGYTNGRKGIFFNRFFMIIPIFLQIGDII